VDVGTHFNSRILNGIFKKLGKGKAHLCRHYSRYLGICSLQFILVGCTSLKKAALIGGGSLGAGAIASIATSGTAPVLLASAGGASVTSVVADVMTPNTHSPKGVDMTNCAPDNFWTLLGSLVEMGGWLLILIVVAPMVLGWILPGPLERKKKE
jgi:hypothetical protein